MLGITSAAEQLLTSQDGLPHSSLCPHYGILTEATLWDCQRAKEYNVHVPVPISN
jgi:hypothetical protein